MSNTLLIEPCINDEQLHQTADLANAIWHEYFPFLLSDEQIDYMVEKFCSFDAMKDLEKHHNYACAVQLQIKENE